MQPPGLGPHIVLGRKAGARRDRRGAEAQPAGVILTLAHGSRHLDIADRGDPALRVDVVDVEAVGLQPRRPGADHVMAAPVAGAEQVRTLAHRPAIGGQGAFDPLEEGGDDRVL